MSNPKFFVVAVLVSEIGGISAKFHTEQNTSNRSCKESAARHLKMAKDKGLTEVNLILRMLQNFDLLERLGLHIRKAPRDVLSMSPDHPYITDQDEICGMLGDMTFSLVAQRLKTSLQWLNYPYRFALLLDDDAEVRASCLQGFQEYVAKFQRMCAAPGTFWKACARRAVMNHAKQQQFKKMCEESEYTESEDMKGVAHDDFNSITQTKLVEDMIRAARVGEVSKSMNKRKSDERTWTELLTSDVCHDKHRFTSVDFENTPVPRGLKDLSVKSLFRVQPKSIPEGYKQVIGFSKTAPYTTSAPATANATVEDFALFDACEQRDELDAGASSWLSTLCTGKRLMIRHPSVEGGKWCIALGTCGGSTVFCLPVVEKMYCAIKYFEVPELDTVKFFPVMSCHDVKARLFDYVSPVGFRVRAGKWCRIFNGPLIVAATEEMTLGQLSAWNAFWDLPKSTVLRLAKEEELAIPREIKRFPDIIIFVAGHFLGDLTDDQKSNIIRKRMKFAVMELDILENEAVQDVLGQADLADLQGDKHEEERSAQKIGSWLKKHNSRSGGAVAGAASGSADGAGSARAYPASAAYAGSLEVTKSWVEARCPPGAVVYEDTYRNAWRVLYGGRKHSRSWTFYNGRAKSATEILKAVWREAVSLGMEGACPYPELLI